MAVKATQQLSSNIRSAIGKRPNPADEVGKEREIKRRASRACVSCRSRKVRCDVAASNSKCTNCKLDKLECVLVASRRGQTGRAGRSNAHAKSLRPDEGSRGRDTHTSIDHHSSATPHSSGSPTITRDVPVSVTFDEDVDKVGQDEGSVSSEVEHGAINQLVDGDPLGIDQTPQTADLAQTPGFSQLPGFIARLSGRISCEDLEFLVKKGAFEVPEAGLRRDILRGYLLGVHPFMPMLDFAAFRDTVLLQREDRQISLLLFQAVMFAGLHALQPDTIQRLGFSSAKQAREIFFHRVRLLYEFDVERDSAAVLQSLILMSSWYGKWDDRKHTWHWTGLAYDVARNMGLHREPTTRFGSEKVRRFRRRLWWSLYIRDRLIALGTRRPMRIRDDEHDVDALKLEDFDMEAPDDTDIDPDLCLSSEENKAIALMCCQLAELCKCIGHVVSSQYTVLNTHPDVPYTMMVVSKRNVDNAEELRACDEELSGWNKTLVKSLRTTTPGTDLDNPQTCVGVCRAILNITYLTVVNVLHRAQALRPSPETPESQTRQSSSKSKVKDTARSLTKAMQTMLRHDQVRYLSPVGVTAVVAASLSHMLDVSADDEDVRDAAAFRLSQNLQVLQALREAYASADAAISFLATVTRRAGLLVPSHSTANKSQAAESHRSGLAVSDQHRFGLSSMGTLSSRNGLQSSRSPRLRGRDGLTESETQLDHSVPQSDYGSIAVNAPDEAAIGPVNPLLDSFGPSYMAGNPMVSAVHYPDPGFDSTFGGLSASATHGAFFDWNIDADPGMDLDAMAFNHDFYSDTFQII